MKTVYILRKKDEKFININFFKAYSWFNSRFFNIEFVSKNKLLKKNIDKDTIIIAWIPLIRKILNKNNIILSNIEIPNWCEKFLKREIKIITLKEAIKFFDSWKKFFIKPYEEHKSFTWFCFENFLDNLKLQWLNLEQKVIISDIINIETEYRFFILEWKIIWFSLYKWNPELMPDINFVKEILKNIKNYPVAYSIDIWVNDKNENFLIETNDSIALWSYWLNEIKYSLMIEKRWEEITKNL